MTITQLEYVLAVYKNRNFVAAAKTCNVSQPTLSMQIKKLEEELDFIIFDRSKTPVLTTERGERFVQQAIKAHHEFRELYQLAKKGDEVSGQLKVGIIPSLAPYLLPSFLKKFSEKYPKLHFILEELQTELIIEKLEQDELDAGLLATPLKNPKIIERVLYYEPFVAYLSKQHPLHKKKTLIPQDVSGEFIWVLDEGHCFRNQVLKICEVGKMGNIEFTGGSLETLKNLVQQGQEMTILPVMATHNLPTRDIREFARPVPTREISLVCARSFYREAQIDALEKTILECLPPMVTSPKKENLKVIRPL